MQMFLTQSEHSGFLFDCVARRPDKVLISTFGIYAGITYSGQDTTQWGEKYRLATRDLLESLRAKGKHRPKVQMMVGVAEYKGCKGEKYCKDCEIQYAKGLIRLVYHAEIFPDFEWRVSTQLHLKCAIFYYKAGPPRGVAGGRNFTDSDWADVTMELSDDQTAILAEHTIELWNNSPELNDKTIGVILDQQQISSKTIDAILSL
jgi:hypothetical protein